jgi:hypothetical protein
MSDLYGKELLIGRYERTRRRTQMKGITCFVLGSALAIFVTWDFHSSPFDWPILIFSILVGLFGFLNINKSRNMPPFSKSPVGLLLAGKAEKKLEVILIRRSNNFDPLNPLKYKAVFSFIDESAGGQNLVYKGKEQVDAVASYLKSNLSKTCEVEDTTFEEYKKKKAEFSTSQSAKQQPDGESQPQDAPEDSSVQTKTE